MALAVQENPDAPVAEARVLRAQRRHPRHHRRIFAAFTERYPSAERATPNSVHDRRRDSPRRIA
jgi:hypothetical protein